MRNVLFLTLGLALLAGVLHAQADDDEDGMDYFPLVPSGNSLQFGLRVIGGPKISFGNLGTVPGASELGLATGPADRTYNDGYVALDFRTDANGNPVNDGLTNTWNYQYASQVTSSGDMSFHAYSAATLGAGLNAKRNSAAGWELRIGHTLGRIGGKVEFDVVAGFSFNSVNAKITGSVPALLTAVTDVYPLYGQTVPTAPYTGPSYATRTVVDENGNAVLDSTGTAQTESVDSSTVLGNDPTRTTVTSQTDVRGHWEIKGAYYTFRVGPLIKLPITERLKLSLSAGAALAYVGTRYTVEEAVDLTDVSTTLTTGGESSRSVLLPAYYADANAEYWLTERSGLFLGASFQKSGSFDQTVGGRNAKIDLGSSYGVQSGITLRF
jgi:hypothetical protein